MLTTMQEDECNNYKSNWIIYSGGGVDSMPSAFMSALRFSSVQ